MKRIVSALVLMVMLAGCANSSGEIERAMSLRSRLLAAESCTFEADITADYGEKIYSFSMKCQGDPQGNLIFTVTQPETITGITGSISNDGGMLTFDDTALYFELLADDQLSPVSAPWVLLKTLRSGYITSACVEDDNLRITIDDSFDEDALQLDIWLDSADLPIRGEILYDGRRILSLDVRNFEIR